MPYNESDYNGDTDYPINCTGDAVTGDAVRFELPVFIGSFRNARFSHFELVTGTIIKDSYGDAKQQHTFTLLLEGGEKRLIKGRNLYKNGTWRKPWQDETLRTVALDDKHKRGDKARAIRAGRITPLI